MIIHNMDQRSDEWFEIRKKKMTASHGQEIGNCGKGLTTYIRKIMYEYFSSAERESFGNKHTERGTQLEPEARFIYEMETGCKVEEVGFIEHSEFVGCSPDGLIGTDGMIEIKCPDDKGYLDLLLDEKPESKYIWQMQMQMLVSERQWCDFMAYNPNFKQSKFIKRYFLDAEKYAKLRTGFLIGEALIKEIENKLKGAK